MPHPSRSRAAFAVSSSTSTYTYTYNATARTLWTRRLHAHNLGGVVAAIAVVSSHARLPRAQPPTHKWCALPLVPPAPARALEFD